jgi:hypothetical protein
VSRWFPAQDIINLIQLIIVIERSQSPAKLSFLAGVGNQHDFRAVILTWFLNNRVKTDPGFGKKQRQIGKYPGSSLTFKRI